MRQYGPRQRGGEQSERGLEAAHGELLPGMVWSCVRGRLFVTALISGALGLLLALAGYLSAAPSYTSEGKVRIRPSRDPLGTTDTTPYFLEFVKTEATRLRSGPVHARTLEDPTIAALEWPEGPVGRRLLERSVQVDFPIGEVITLRVTTGDGASSQLLINALLRSYLEMQDQELRAKASSITEPLGIREEALRQEHRAAREVLEAQVAVHGGKESLTRLLDTLDEEGLRLAAQRRDAAAEIDLLNRQIQRRRGEHEAWKGRLLGEDGAQVGPTSEELYLRDKRLADLLDQRGQLEHRIAVELESGLLVSHPSIIRAQGDIQLLEGMIEQRLRSLVDQWWSEFGVETAQQEQRVVALGRRITDAQEQQTELAARRADAAAALQRITELSDRADEALARVREVADRREEIGLDMAQGGATQRLGQAEILQWGDLPVWPSRNPRKLRAAAGLVAGGGLGVGLVVAFGLVSRRYRFTDEVASSGTGIPLLGTLPMLAPRDLASPERLGATAHQLRTAIEMGADGQPRQGASVHAITSATAGEGKSTLAVALAASFAASGQRTLLVDADPQGGAITHRFGIDAARPGFCEAVRRPDIEVEPAPTRIDGLDVLPVGGAEADRMPASSLAGTARLFERLRGRYDRIVVDTGVLAGSAEAAQCCRSADGVLAVVSRGQSRAEVDNALARLAEMGLWCEGLVFNRAQPQDAARYTSVPAASASRADAGAGRQAAVSSAYS